jgi:hypothetical protein
MALITVLLMLALLLMLAMMLGDKVTRAIRSAALTGTRDQALQAAGGGIEWARHQLAVTYPTSSGWATYLAAAPGGELYPETPAFTAEIGRVPVDIFLRDNPDDGGDPQHDNDLKLMVLARARPPGGPEVLIESLCGFDAASVAGYRQAGGNGQRDGQAEADPDEPPADPTVTFPLQD